jgi:Fe(3+) dicitrate transport protein
LARPLPEEQPPPLRALPTPPPRYDPLKSLPFLPLLSLFLAPTLLAQDPTPGGEEPEAKKQEVPEILVIGRTEADGVPVVPIDAYGSRDVFGPEQIRQIGARDLNDLVQYLPAASTRPYNGGEASAPSFSMRGLPDDGLTEYLNVLIDGVPASPLPYGWTAFSFLPLTTERVHAMDYIRGGHTVRYSPNTVGGVLNFLTAPIPSSANLDFRSTLGSFDYSSTLLSYGQTLGDFGYVATYVDRRGEGYRENGGFDQQDLNLKFRWQLGEESWLATSFTHTEDEHMAPGGLTLAQFEQNPFGNARPENLFDGFRSVADVVYHSGGDDAWVEGFGYLSQTGRHLRAQRPHFGAAATISDWDDESFFGAVGLRGQMTTEMLGMEHELYYGVRYHRDWIPSWKLRSEPYPGGASTLTQDAEFSVDTFSLHLDDTFRPTDELLVNLGARLEWIPGTSGEDRVGGWEFEDEFLDVLPAIGASYTLSDDWALFGNYAEGFRAPQVWGYAYTTKPKDALEFEKGRSMELGTRWTGAAGLSGSLTGWRVDYDDFGVFYSGFYENLGQITATGADVVVEWDAGAVTTSLDGFSMLTSFTVQDSELGSGPDAGNETPYAWEHKAAWMARYETESGWYAALGGTYVGDSFSDEANTTQVNPDGNLGLNPSRTIWDGRVAKLTQLDDQVELELALGATNLADESWHVHSRGGFFGGGQVAGPPRQFYFSAALSVRW